MKAPGVYALLVLGALAAAQPAAAESPWRLGVAMGYGERTNPLVFSEDIPIVVDIDVAWFGKRFFFDNGDLGYTFADNSLFTGSLVARFNSDRVFFGKTETRFVNFGFDGAALTTLELIEVPDRDYAVEAGFELLADGSWGYLQFAAHHDVSGKHDGYELDVNYGIGWRSERWYIEPSVGVSFKSAELNTYYWGVRLEESNTALPVYETGSGINLRGRLALSYYVSRHWALSFAGEYERLNSDAASSPIVRERQTLGYFAGIRYRF
ncbi:MAG: MipA/OmpV family protein [Pseudomonadota bacterium]